MTSFVRTAQQEEYPEYIEEILNRTNHYIPLKFYPWRAHPGDFIYLAHRERIVGRARISRIDRGNFDVYIGSKKLPFKAKCLVRYEEGWQRAPREIPFRGYQGIRYLDTEGLEKLDLEQWISVQR